jgi:4'-phosphopantetheinyl transferase
MSDNLQSWKISPAHVLLDLNEVHVWKASLEVPLNVVNHLKGVLSPDECDRAKQFYFEKDRRHWIVAHGILRLLLGHYLDVEANELHFVTNDHGKPGLVQPPHKARLHFNLSHSGEIALYAFAYDRQVGIDVEYMRGLLDYEEVATHYFSSYECAVLRALPVSYREDAFFTCWTRKEAYIKARGIGLSQPLDEFDVSLTPSEPAALLADRSDPEAPGRWSLCTLALEDRYAGALAVEGSGWQLSCWEWHSSMP